MAKQYITTTSFLICIIAVCCKGQTCLGPFQLCPTTNDCSLSSKSCGTCTAGQYVCPINQDVCVDSAEDYINCPGLKGTHLDWTLSIEERLLFLVNNLTLDEKYTQLTNQAPEIYRLGIPFYNWLNDDLHGVRQHHSTTFPDGCGLGATWDKQVLNKVGSIIGYEARSLYNRLIEQGIRGENENGYTITAYSPNVNLVRDPRWGRSQEVYSEDPLLSSRLAYEFVTGMQTGDGDNDNNNDNNNSNGSDGNDSYLLIGACCKHFAAYDIETKPERRYFFNAVVDSRNWQETYSPVFYSCVKTAQASHVMCSYNSINGVPACGNSQLLTNVLRNEWNFTGFVVSDYDAMAQIYSTHHYASSFEQAASIAIKAGCDQEGGSTKAIDQIPRAINNGLLTIDDINTALSRLFRIRIKLGLFDPPTIVKYNYLTVNNSDVEGIEHLEYAREVAGKAIGLYKNDNNALPLDSGNINKIVVIGPQAVSTNLLLGNYATYPDKGVATILQALREALGENDTTVGAANCIFNYNSTYYKEIDDKTSVTAYTDKECCNLCYQNDLCDNWTFFDSKCHFKTNMTRYNQSKSIIGTSGECINSANKDGNHSKVSFEYGCLDIRCETDLYINDALKLITKEMTQPNGNILDAVIAFIGLDQTLESEAHDRSTINLPGYQVQLISNISQLLLSSSSSSSSSSLSGDHIPLICIMIHGGTLGLTDILDKCDAIIDAWYGGVMAAYGIADVLFNKVNPAARVSVTYYASDDDLPTPGEMDLYAQNGVTYRYYKGENEPVFPFGYGLSYTTFEYSMLAVGENRKYKLNSFDACDVINVSVKVTNTGNYDGDEVVQLYVKQPYATVAAPQIRLADFERVFIPKGESLIVNLQITPKFHSVVYNSSNETDLWWQPNTYIEKGNINIFVGGGQPKYYQGCLNMTVSIENSNALTSCQNQD